MKRLKSECPKALDPAERLDMDVEAGGSDEDHSLRQGRLLRPPGQLKLFELLQAILLASAIEGKRAAQMISELR